MRIHNLASRSSARVLLVLSATLLTLGVAACGGGDDADATATPTTATNPTQPAGGGEGEPITIALKDNFFEPKDITVPVNTEVEITVENTGTAIHNMHVLSKDKEGQDFSSDTIVSPGASSTFEVKFTKTGTYDFVCDYHLPDMAGTITVE